MANEEAERKIKIAEEDSEIRQKKIDEDIELEKEKKIQLNEEEYAEQKFCKRKVIMKKK